jgi:metal-responsive CopG/Arc/MetJ family transcriptional regulator
MTLDEDLVKAVDRMVKKLRTTRSAFARTALRDALEKYRVLQLEQRHRSGYEQHPPADDEFGSWVAEQAWGDE